jgi:aspartyl aminopeptidase
VHLDREVNDRGLALDRQQHLTPVWGLGQPAEGAFAQWLGTELGVGRSVASWDLLVHDLTPPARLGVDDELLAAGRLDNLCSCFAATEALLAAAERQDRQERPLVIALFDHEEVGSASATGADGPMLEWALVRLVRGVGGDADDVVAALSASACVSADMAHSVHPNYPERHEPGHRPLPNAGPVVKVNASQRYATDATSQAAFTAACERAGVPWQVFVSKNSMPCGSTIGPITAARPASPRSTWAAPSSPCTRPGS